MTQREILLQVAARLPQPFTRSQLIVACWQESPQHFALDGYPDYPDAHAVQYVLYAKYGPLRRGELRRDGAGFRVATAADSPALPLPLVTARHSRAFRLFAAGHKDAITFADALVFWSVGRAVEGDPVKRAIDRMSKLLDADGGPEYRELAACHSYLVERFRKRIALAS